MSIVEVHWRLEALVTLGNVRKNSGVIYGSTCCCLNSDKSFVVLVTVNFHLGARAKSDNRPSIYPDINFCKTVKIVYAFDNFRGNVFEPSILINVCSCHDRCKSKCNMQS